MTDFIIGGIILIIVGLAIAYIIKEKKRGVKCVGCPAGVSCSGKHKGDSGCGCGCQSETR